MCHSLGAGKSSTFSAIEKRGQRGSWVDAVGEGEGRERHRGHKGHGRRWILLPGCWESVQGSHRERAVMDLYLEKIAPAAVGRLGPQGQEGRRKLFPGVGGNGGVGT